MNDDRYLNVLKRTNIDIYDNDSLHKQLQKSMPGKWSQMHLTKLVQKLPGNKDFLQKTTNSTECVKTIDKEVQRLLDIIDFKDVNYILEPFDGTSCISKYLKTKLGKELKMLTNDISPDHGNPDLCENALDSKLYNEHGQFDAIVTSPWFAMNDIAIPLMMKHCKYFLAVHVPSYYICNAPAPRMQFIKKLTKEKRLFIISDMPRDNPTRMSCLWMVIFTNKDVAKKFIKNHEIILPFIL
jgi:hypothetical protein